MQGKSGAADWGVKAQFSGSGHRAATTVAKSALGAMRPNYGSAQLSFTRPTSGSNYATPLSGASPPQRTASQTYHAPLHTGFASQTGLETGLHQSPPPDLTEFPNWYIASGNYPCLPACSASYA